MDVTLFSCYFTCWFDLFNACEGVNSVLHSCGPAANQSQTIQIHTYTEGWSSSGEQRNKGPGRLLVAQALALPRVRVEIEALDGTLIVIRYESTIRVPS
jgi:hypothetical protein